METSTTLYDTFFLDYDTSLSATLREVLIWFETVSRPAVTFQYYLSFFGVILTVLHLLVLTRKYMLTTSIIAIMIGIAICDLATMLIAIESSYMMFDETGTQCDPPVTLFEFHVFWLLISVRDLVRRASTWLGVLMALLRYLVLKFAGKPKFQALSEVASGFKCVIGCFLASTLFSMIYYFRYDIVEVGTWKPMKNCTNVPLTTVLPTAAQKPSALFTMYNGIFGRIYMFTNGIISKILPCILLPLLTILLILELRRATSTRKNPKRRSRSEKSTGLVIFMAFSFFIGELPAGIVTVFQVAFTEMGYIYLSTYIQHFSNAIFIINAISHCLCCFLMSSKYRKTVAKYVKKGGDKPTTTIVVSSVFSGQ